MSLLVFSVRLTLTSSLTSALYFFPSLPPCLNVLSVARVGSKSPFFPDACRNWTTPTESAIEPNIARQRQRGRLFTRGRMLQPHAPLLCEKHEVPGNIPSALYSWP